MSRKPKIDIYQEITDSIVVMIEEGAGEFLLPWHCGSALGRPYNIETGKPFTGMNILILWVAAMQKGYEQSVWGTFSQWNKIGCRIRHGEKASLVLRPIIRTEKTMDCEEPDDSETPKCIGWRKYDVFNADQVDGYVAPDKTLPVTPLFSPVKQAERFLADSGARVTERGTKACYRPAKDDILLPDRGRFVGSESMSADEAFYATAMHELTHWTGHSSRCDRDLGNRFGSPAYAKEELVAELGAAFICADHRITLKLRPDHARYIESWLKVLKSDKKAIFTAARKAQQAVSYLEDVVRRSRRRDRARRVKLRPTSRSKTLPRVNRRSASLAKSRGS